MPSPRDLVTNCVRELSQETGQCYTAHIEESEVDDPEVIILVVNNETNNCFHMAITGTNTDIENAKEVCFQAVLERSLEDDPDLYCAVYDSLAQKVSFFLCSPSKQEFEDMSCYSVQGELDEVVKWLKTSIVGNAAVLRQ